MSGLPIGLLILTLPFAGPTLLAQLPLQSASAPPSSGQAVPTLVTTARMVVLDVVVADKDGTPVEGLKKADFQLTEDGVPQTLTSFTEHDDLAHLPPPEQTERLPPNTFADHAPLTGNGAITVILFDELSFADAAYARYEVDSYLKTLKPGMPICIFRLDWKGLHLIEDFTTDPQALREAVSSKRNSQGLSPPSAVLGQSSLFESSIHQLASYLSGFSGRKNLIWFTDGPTPDVGSGRPDSLFPDLSSFLFDDPSRVLDVLTLSRVALYPVDARGLVYQQVLSQDLQMADAAARTGGRAFYSTNGLKEAVAEVVSTGSRYYTLAYVPGNSHWDGAYRKIRVKVTNFAGAQLANRNPSAAIRPPLRLEFRDGYYAQPPAPVGPLGPASAGARRIISYSPKGDPRGRGVSRGTPFQQAMAFGAVAPFQIMFTAHVTPAAATQKIKRHDKAPPGNFLGAKWLHSPYRDYQIHYVIDPRTVEFRSQTVDSYSDVLQFAAVVYDDYGQVVNSAVSSTSIDLKPAQYMQAMQSKLGFTQTIAMPSQGNYFLRLGIHEVMSDHIGALEVPAEVIKQEPAERGSSSQGPATP